MQRLKQALLHLILGLSLLSTTPAFAQDDELLPPEKAFALQAWMEDNLLIAEYQIAPGYYVYRKRFDFQIESSGARFDTAIIPDGKIKNDEFFGDMEIYRDSVRIVLPVLYDSDIKNTFRVKAVSQGCADIGICYPPLAQSLDMKTGTSARITPVAYAPPADPTEDEKAASLQALLADATSTTSATSDINIESSNSNALSILQSLGEEVGLADDEEIPHPDTAFMLSASLDANNIIQSNIVIYPNTYLYRDKVVQI